MEEKFQKAIDELKENLLKLKDNHNKIYEEKVKKRQESNKKLLTILKEQIINYPNLRFIQILWMLNIIDEEDRFYEESEETLKIVLKKLNKLQEERKGE